MQFNIPKLYKSDKIFSRTFILNKLPDKELFLIEANIKYVVYINLEHRIFVESVTYEDGLSDNKLIMDGKNEYVKLELTDKDYDSIIKEINKKPIHIVQTKYMMTDGIPIKVSIVDNTIYYGEIEFNSKKQLNTWKPNDILSKYIIEDGSKFSLEDYWRKTRLRANRYNK